MHSCHPSPRAALLFALVPLAVVVAPAPAWASFGYVAR
jgi:hypothetical protein